jgi:hypothetical protein
MVMLRYPKCRMHKYRKLACINAAVTGLTSEDSKLTLVDVIGGNFARLVYSQSGFEKSSLR